VLKVSVEGDVNTDTGFVMDYGDINIVVKPVIARLDHFHLGANTREHGPATIPGLRVDLYPSSENLLLWLGTQIDDQIGRKFWSELELNETCTSSCVLTREEYDRTIGCGQGNMGEAK